MRTEKIIYATLREKGGCLSVSATKTELIYLILTEKPYQIRRGMLLFTSPWSVAIDLFSFVCVLVTR